MGCVCNLNIQMYVLNNPPSQFTNYKEVAVIFVRVSIKFLNKIYKKSFTLVFFSYTFSNNLWNAIYAGFFCWCGKFFGAMIFEARNKILQHHPGSAIIRHQMGDMDSSKLLRHSSSRKEISRRKNIHILG